MVVMEMSSLPTDQIWERSVDATAVFSGHSNTILIPLGIFSLAGPHFVSPRSSLPTNHSREKLEEVNE